MDTTQLERVYRAEAPRITATLADCERYLPAGHPMTQTIRENLEAAR